VRADVRRGRPSALYRIQRVNGKVAEIASAPGDRNIVRRPAARPALRSTTERGTPNA